MWRAPLLVAIGVAQQPSRPVFNDVRQFNGDQTMVEWKAGPLWPIVFYQPTTPVIPPDARADFERSFAAADAEMRARFRALQERAAPSRVLLLRWNKWGLYCSWNALVRALLWALVSNRTLCLLEADPSPPVRKGEPPWPYHPSVEYERRHNCSGLRCYVDFPVAELWPPACASAVRGGGAGAGAAAGAATVSAPQHFKVSAYDPVMCGAATRFDAASLGTTRAGFVPGALANLSAALGGRWDEPTLRSVVTRWMFEAPSAATRAFLAWRARELALPADFVAVHIRWGDKTAKETQRINASEYVAAARLFAPDEARRDLFVATTSPQALADVRAHARAGERIFATNASHLPDELSGTSENIWLSHSLKREENFLEAFADVWNIIQSRGAVLTLSSNMGRWVWFHNLLEIRLGRQQIKLLDSFGSQASFLGKYPPQACNY